MPSDSTKVKRTRKTTQLLMLERQEKVSDLYRQGLPLHEIAKSVGVSGVTVSSDMKAVRDRYKERANRSYADWLEEELAKLDLLEKLAYEDYERSRETKVRTKIKRRPSKRDVDNGADPDDFILSQTIDVQERRAGDPRFLEIIKDCSTKRMKLLGFLDERPVVNNVNQQVIDWTALAKPPEKVDRIEEQIKRLESISASTPSPEN